MADAVAEAAASTRSGCWPAAARPPAAGRRSRRPPTAPAPIRRRTPGRGGHAHAEVAVAGERRRVRGALVGRGQHVRPGVPLPAPGRPRRSAPPPRTWPECRRRNEDRERATEGSCPPPRGTPDASVPRPIPYKPRRKLSVPPPSVRLMALSAPEREQFLAEPHIAALVRVRGPESRAVDRADLVPLRARRRGLGVDLPRLAQGPPDRACRAVQPDGRTHRADRPLRAVEGPITRMPCVRTSCSWSMSRRYVPADKLPAYLDFAQDRARRRGGDLPQAGALAVRRPRRVVIDRCCAATTRETMRTSTTSSGGRVCQWWVRS